MGARDPLWLRLTYFHKDVNYCEVCQLLRPPNRPVQSYHGNLHLDYAGPLQGKMYLVLVDTYSKWLEVKIVPTATASATIDVSTIFADHGLP